MNRPHQRPLTLLALLAPLTAAVPAAAATYDVGPGQPLAAIGDVPWSRCCRATRSASTGGRSRTARSG